MWPRIDVKGLSKCVDDVKDLPFSAKPQVLHLKCRFES